MSLSGLPVRPPVAPMLARLSRQLPEGPGLFYEPKWDGFRAVVFKDGAEVEVTSRNELSLTRYFPELVAVLRQALPEQVVLDGEVVVAGPDGLDFDALSQRLHPAESRVRQLAKRTPASFVAFDLLALGARDLRAAPFVERRRLLTEVLGTVPFAHPPGVHLTPATRDPAQARDWFERFEGAGLDGVVAKAEDLAYLEGKRAMVKVKHERTAEFVVAGYRPYRAGARGTDGPGEVGSLLLGLYLPTGDLAHVGVIGAFSADERRRLAVELAPYKPRDEGEASRHPWASWARPRAGEARAPGARSRWNSGKDLSFEALRPELVVEAAYEHLQGPRLRHTAQFRRWRPDRAPRSCTYEQLAAVVPVELGEVFGAGGPASGTAGASGAAVAGAD